MRLLIVLVFPLVISMSCEPVDSNYEKVATGPIFYNDTANKYWKHRVNTLYDIKKYEIHFTGIELDVVYYPDEDELAVQHDPIPEERLLLEDYFKAFSHIERMYFWIDIKNLEEVDVQAFTDKLLSILQVYNIADRIICESIYPRKLNELNNEGLYTSYWIPYVDYDGTLTLEQYATLNTIKQNLSKYRHNAISAHYTMLPFIEQYLPSCTVHLWTNGLSSREDEAVIRELATHAQVKVILIDYDAPLD